MQKTNGKLNWIFYSIRSLSKIANRNFIQFFIHHQRPSTVIRRHEMLHEAPVLPNEDPEDGDALFLWTAKRFQLTDHLRENCRFFCFSFFYPFSILPKCSLRECFPAHIIENPTNLKELTNVRLKICMDIVAVWKAELDKVHLLEIRLVEHIETMVACSHRQSRSWLKLWRPVRPLWREQGLLIGG